MQTKWLVRILSLSAFACTGAQTTPDPGAAPADGGVRDGGAVRDAGVERLDAGVADAGRPDAAPTLVPLFDESTVLDPPLVEDTPTALVTRFADRGRDRHAREAQFQAYEHYLPLYWEYRTVRVEVTDTVGKGGDTIRFDVESEWKLQAMQAELRFFYRGQNTVAEYHDNRPMTAIDDLHYTREVSFNAREGRPLQVGDKMEFEISQFLDAPPRGRTNYYGTTFLYIVGEGLVPWIGSGPLRDSEVIPEAARLGGDTTIHAAESDEPPYDFSQMATNLAPDHAQRFVVGRRLAHTSFDTGRHDESAENPVWNEQAGKSGPLAINDSCNACHLRNGRAVPPPVGAELSQYVVKVGAADGGPHPALGEVLQPSGEPDVTLAAWDEEDGLRRPRYTFDGAAPEHFSARISPQLVGLGLLEAIPEEAVAALADPDDADGDQISGRMHIVGERLGRFGYKASQPTVRQQTAAALRTDMGVLTSVYPTPDCGEAQTGCGPSGAELDDDALDDLALYVALLGMRPQRNFDDPAVTDGAVVFRATGCVACHVDRFTTSAYAPNAEVRAQTIAPYTDLLLHDMGPGLADALPEGDASGPEWRTAPLWGIGRTLGVSGAEAYLHDGRARTLDEAIRWHGGEGTAARDAYLALDAAEREQLLSFLRSL
ncbi:MAG: di-heme oxidoredictase family protein [Deltaproteobacteria bacterium]